MFVGTSLPLEILELSQPPCKTLQKTKVFFSVTSGACAKESHWGGRDRTRVGGGSLFKIMLPWPDTLTDLHNWVQIMVIDLCTPNIQTCIIHFCVRSNILIKMMYHTWLYDKCTMTYDHICTQFWRSVSASAALTPAVRVRIRPTPSKCLCDTHTTMHVM